MAIEWDPDARQWHLRNDHLSLILGVRESGELGQLYLGSALAAGTDYRHLARGPFPGWDNRLGESIPARAAHARHGRLSTARTRRHLRRWVAGDAHVLHRASHRYREARAARPAEHVCRDPPRRTRSRSSLADARTGLRATVRLTLFRDHAAFTRSVTVRNDGAEPLASRCSCPSRSTSRTRAGSASRSTARGRGNGTSHGRP